MPIFDAATRYAATRYAADKVPLVILAGAEYGSGSSRDWAAKGTLLLGVKAVLATSFERIHRSNLIGMGVLPPQFAAAESVESLGLTGEEEYAITGLTANGQTGPLPREVTVQATSAEGTTRGSPPRCASTPLPRPATTATAASCSTCCASCSSDDHGSRPSIALGVSSSRSAATIRARLRARAEGR